MKKLLPFCLMILSVSLPALACIERGAEPMSNKQIRGYAEQNSTFASCLQKLLDTGVSLNKVIGFRKVRPDNYDGPITYTFAMQGVNGAGQLTRIQARYNLKKHVYECTLPTTNLPKCM